MKVDGVVGLRKIYIALARFIQRRLCSTVEDVAAFRVKLGANDLNCVDVPLNPTHSLIQTPTREHWIQRITFAAETNAACSRYLI